MTKFILGLLLGLSIASAAADFAIDQPNGQVAIIKATVSNGIQTITVACQ